jgi:hypothetical protein
MRRLSLLAMLAVSVCGFSALASATVAYAVPEWLVDSESIVLAVEATSSGSLEFTDTKTRVGRATIKCSLILDGELESEGKAIIREVLNLAGEKISEPEGLGLSCLGVTMCEMAGAELWPEKLPWKATLELMLAAEADYYLIKIEGGAWKSLCLILGIGIEDLCEGTTSGEAKNLTGGTVEQIFSQALFVETQLVSCTEGGASSGELKGSLVTSLTGKTLSLSE